MDNNHFKEIIKRGIISTIDRARKAQPLVPAITNTVTINFVANAELAVGGSAAMIYMADEAEYMAKVGDAMYINLGTVQEFYHKTVITAVQTLGEQKKRWVLDPVGIGMGEIRTSILKALSAYKPSIIRGNASEIISTAKLWGICQDNILVGTKGVDSRDSVQSAKKSAVELARYTAGAVAVSGVVDLVTDGKIIVYLHGGSSLMEKVTGFGCSLGGVCAVYSSVADPFIASITATAIYNYAGKRAEKIANGTGTFQMSFLDELFNAKAEEVAGMPFEVEEI